MTTILFALAIVIFLGASAVEELRHRNHSLAATDLGLALLALALLLIL